MPRRKARNPVRKRNLLKMKKRPTGHLSPAETNQTQVVNVVVKNTKTVRKREPKATEPVMSRNRLLPPTPSVTVMNQQPDYRTLLSLLTQTGRTPQPAQPSRGLINQPPNVPQSQGLGRFLLQQAPQTDSDDVSPTRYQTTTYQTPPVAPPNSEASLTTLGGAVQKLERIRSLLASNVDYVPPTAEIKKLIQRRDKLSRLADQQDINEEIREKQMKRIDDMKDYNRLMELWRDTRQNIKRLGAVRNLPPNTTVKDFEDIDNTETGLMAMIKKRVGGTPWSDHRTTVEGGGSAVPPIPQPNFDEDDEKKED